MQLLISYGGLKEYRTETWKSTPKSTPKLNIFSLKIVKLSYNTGVWKPDGN